MLNRFVASEIECTGHDYSFLHLKTAKMITAPAPLASTYPIGYPDLSNGIESPITTTPIAPIASVSDSSCGLIAKDPRLHHTNVGTHS